MTDGKKEHGVGKLAMEPEVLVERQPSGLWPQPTHDGAAHGQQDEGGIDAQHQAGAARDPDGVGEGVERRQSGVGDLFVPEEGARESVRQSVRILLDINLCDGGRTGRHTDHP